MFIVSFFLATHRYLSSCTEIYSEIIIVYIQLYYFQTQEELQLSHQHVRLIVYEDVYIIFMCFVTKRLLVPCKTHDFYKKQIQLLQITVAHEFYHHQIEIQRPPCLLHIFYDKIAAAIFESGYKKPDTQNYTNLTKSNIC